ncbi:uncharacterized protein LOC109286452 [Alligator mississippiensis]|uniref:uncharacterized protein LOC109286452 n=1 Tax=Alligator mississippiensis TaxID=8496 RepID=UPI00287762F3|nr:uncharacterized protein LOC109286452 [Alligator mississippiensis]XP_059575220.1 uncharacterized protein LOC109286452 [Alligator mississippiensis]
MATRMGLKGTVMEKNLIRCCPWRTGTRHIENANDLWAHIAYHQAVEGDERNIDGYFSVKREEAVVKEWRTKLSLGEFRCIMGSDRVYYRSPEETSTISLAGVKARKAEKLTPAQEFAQCIRYLREGGESTPTDWFNCPDLVPESRGHELLIQLREDLETKGRHVPRWGLTKWKKGKMINVLFRTVTGLLREYANLEAQMHTAGKESLEWAAKSFGAALIRSTGCMIPLAENGAERSASHLGNPERRGRVSEDLAGIHLVPPPPEVTLSPAAPPSCQGEGAMGGEIYPTLPDEEFNSFSTTAHPIAVTKHVADEDGTTRTTVISHAHTRPEIQELCKESKIRSGETLAMWLGRLIVEFGSDTFDKEASALTRQAAWSGGRATDLNVVIDSAHWPILIPALVVGQVTHKFHTWHKGRPQRATAEQLLLAIVGVSYLSWSLRTNPMGLTAVQQKERWAHRHLSDPGAIPTPLEAIEACMEVYGGANAVTLRLFLNPMAGQPVGNLLGHLPRLQALMQQGEEASDTIRDRSSIYPAGTLRPRRQEFIPRREQRWSPPGTPKERTLKERTMFGFLLSRTGLTKAQL